MAHHAPKLPRASSTVRRALPGQSLGMLGSPRAGAPISSMSAYAKQPGPDWQEGAAGLGAAAAARGAAVCDAPAWPGTAPCPAGSRRPRGKAARCRCSCGSRCRGTRRRTGGGRGSCRCSSLRARGGSYVILAHAASRHRQQQSSSSNISSRSRDSGAPSMRGRPVAFAATAHAVILGSLPQASTLMPSNPNAAAACTHEPCVWGGSGDSDLWCRRVRRHGIYVPRHPVRSAAR